jgi:hypothetical protein
MNIFQIQIVNQVGKIFLNLAVLYISLVAGSCQTHCDLRGNWLIKKGNLTPDYQRTGYQYSQNRINFSLDQIELASGFFYDILPKDSNDWALGRYPFVYYGNLERYKIVGDTLQIYSRPYSMWESFKMQCVGDNELILRIDTDTVILTRDINVEPLKYCSIKSISAHVYEIGLGLYANNYNVSYSKDDNLVFQQWSDKEPSAGAKYIKLKPGTFDDICRGLSRVDLTKLKRRYPSKASELEVKDLEIEFTDGTRYEFHLENDDYPEDLMLALVPVLYGHQQYVYGDLPAVK